MKRHKIILLLFVCSILTRVAAQEEGTGLVTDAEGAIIAGASVTFAISGYKTATDASGQFSFPLQHMGDTMTVSHVGFEPTKRILPAQSLFPLHIVLTPNPKTLQEVVVNTGYYQVPLERATGAFTHIDNKTLNRSVGGNILQRLEGVTNSLLFDRRNLTEENIDGQPGLRIRGVSTIEASNEPLIVIDNFPYEGDITTINPDDIESVTLLRDAAAASIWGARAGNGVIVITTKSGQYNQSARIDFNSNITVGDKPDLYYSKNFLPSATVMEIQKALFNRNAYRVRDRTKIPSYVDLLAQQRDGEIDDETFSKIESRMRNNDLRSDWLEYLYRPAIKQRYALNVRGGGVNYHYALSAGIDRNKEVIVGNENSRINLSLRNTFRVTSKLELTGDIWYAAQRRQKNGSGFSSLSNNAEEIYGSLVDEHGNPAAVNGQNYRLYYHQQAQEQGLLDWMYRPLEEIDLWKNGEFGKELRLNGGATYQVMENLAFRATYQFIESQSGNETHYDKESYYVRHLVNRYTQSDGLNTIPYGDILDYGRVSAGRTHSGRLQLNYQREFGQNHQLDALLGSEIRQHINSITPGVRLYNFSPDNWLGYANFDYVTRYPVRPTGSATIPYTTGAPSKLTNRYLSYFANAGYIYRKRYVFSGSVRWDGSNLLGVKTNQRGTALWSLGGSWEVSKEPFYPLEGLLPYARIRATFGSAGNIDKTQSQYPVITLGTNASTNLPFATLTHPGNPSLKWEQVNTLNLGIDFNTKGRRISGSIEYYVKHAKNLLGAVAVDPTNGIMPGATYKMNYGSLRTAGWDFQLNSVNTKGALQWQSHLLVNTSANRITHLETPQPLYNYEFLSSQIPEKGKSIDRLYALPWHGLSHDTGLPIVRMDGVESTEDAAYNEYYLNFPYTELIVAGTAVPKIFGSLRNLFSYKGFQLSAMISFKMGHVFRRSSMAPGREYNASSPVYHMDYFERWKKPGDERRTDVPAATEVATPNTRWYVYQYAEVLITKGDLIRLQDINLSYTFSGRSLRNFHVKSLRIFGYLNNLGILWRANKHGIDPDYLNTLYPAMRQVSFGLAIQF